MNGFFFKKPLITNWHICLELSKTVYFTSMVKCLFSKGKRVRVYPYAIYTGKHGSPQPWYFPLSPKYWGCSSQKKDKQEIYLDQEEKCKWIIIRKTKIIIMKSISGVGYMLSKNWWFFGPHMLRMNFFFNNILTLYLFAKLVVLTLEWVKINFNLSNLYTMVVHWKKWCFGLHVAPLCQPTPHMDKLWTSTIKWQLDV